MGEHKRDTGTGDVRAAVRYTRDMHRWQIVPTPQGPTLHVDGRVVGSPGLPPPPGWLQRAYGITLPSAYDRARMRVLGYAEGVR